MQTDPVDQHRWLKKFVGEWTTESSCGPDQVMRGRESARMLGDLWMSAEATSEMPGGTSATMVLTLGYDVTKKRFVGTWIGSMMSNLWVYDGSLDAGGRVLTLSSEGPSWDDPNKLATYRDVHEFISDNERTLTGMVLGEDGQWTPMMTVKYTRVK
jgi:hypothetical protein